MKIIFLNTWHGKLRDELGAYVQQHVSDTDIFCFQEAQPYDREPYADILEKFSFYYAEKSQSKEAESFGNAIYVRPGIDVTDSGSLFVDEDDAGMVAYVTAKDGDEELTICNVHGAPRPYNKLDTEVRLRQSKEILRLFNDQTRVVIGGDFNLLPETDSIKMFELHGYQNLISDYAIKTTRNRITFDLYPDDTQYFADYAFVSPSIKIESFVVPSKVVSDHQPLELTIE